jgi:hypothetical protein
MAAARASARIVGVGEDDASSLSDLRLCYCGKAGCTIFNAAMSSAAIYSIDVLITYFLSSGASTVLECVKSSAFLLAGQITGQSWFRVCDR